VGKIANALDKYAQERKNSQTPGLTRADMEILLAYDRETCHLLNYHPGDENLDQQSSEGLRTRGTIQRLLAHQLIYPSGKLTPKGLRKCERLEKAAARNVPSVGSRAQEASQLSGGGNDTDSAAAEPIESLQARQTAPEETFRPQPVKKEAQHSPQDSDAAGFVAADLSGETADYAAQTRSEKPATEKPPTAAPPEAETDAAGPSAAISNRRETEERRSETEDRPKPKDEKKYDNKLLSALEPHSYVAEQFKILRTSLLYPIKGKPPQTILVTSALPGEGKSFVSANLAVSIALNINKHVLLVDCDMRKPDIHRQFGFGEGPGLTEYLTESSDLASLLLKTGVDKLTILPGGGPPPNPAELLSSERMTQLIHEVKHRYPDRFIVIDSPPMNLAAETGFLGREVDGIIVVVRHGKTPRRDIEDLLELVEREKIIGFVLNAVDTPLKRKYGYKANGKYGKYGSYYR